jgi:DNA-binding response OmpR family regulator
MKKWKDFAKALAHHCRTDVTHVRSDAEAVDAAREKMPSLMIIDQDLGHIPGIELVPRLLRINAMIHTALVSDQPEEIFHDRTEGLGILMKLSPLPNRQEAVHLCERLSGVV